MKYIISLYTPIWNTLYFGALDGLAMGTAAIDENDGKNLHRNHVPKETFIPTFIEIIAMFVDQIDRFSSDRRIVCARICLYYNNLYYIIRTECKLRNHVMGVKNELRFADA